MSRLFFLFLASLVLSVPKPRRCPVICCRPSHLLAPLAQLQVLYQDLFCLYVCRFVCLFVQEQVCRCVCVFVCVCLQAHLLQIRFEFSRSSPTTQRFSLLSLACDWSYYIYSSSSSNRCWSRVSNWSHLLICI